MAGRFCVVFITTPPGKARMIATKIIQARLAACVNTIPVVESRYWWKDKIETAKEALLIVKSARRSLPKLTTLVKRIHPYSIPEIIALPIVAGNKPYLKWLNDEII